MGMTLYLIPKTDEQIDALRQQTPQEVFDALYPVDPASFDMHKAWHGVHFLMTGTAWEGEAPLNYLMDGLPLGPIPEPEEWDDYEDDVWGYGPPHALYRREVSAWADALEPLTEEVLRARFDPAAFKQADLYGGVGQATPEEALEWMMDYYISFREFLREMTEAGYGLVVMTI